MQTQTAAVSFTADEKGMQRPFFIDVGRRYKTNNGFR
jgi:hypothetical protein